jgi:hypothetical protein
VYVLGDFKGNRMQVRLDSSGPAGEFSMEIRLDRIASTDELIRAVIERIDLILDELQPEGA